MGVISESNSSLAWKHNIRHKRGDSFVRVFKFYQDEASTVPQSIVGRDFKAAIVNPKTGRAVIESAIGSGLTIQNTNELKWELTAEAMKIAADVYPYDIEQKTTAGDFHFTIIEGEFKLDQDRKQWNT